MELIFEKARITGLEAKITGPNVINYIKCVAKLTPKLAKEMGSAAGMFDQDQIPRAWYKEVILDFEVKALKARFTVQGIDHVLHLTSEGADKFKAVKVGDKKKGKKSYLAVKFRIVHAGSPFELLEYILKMGGAEGTLTITSMQAELPFEEKSKGKRNGHVETKPAAGTSERPIPSDPNAPEWREPEEIEAGVPHHVTLDRPN